MRGNAFRTKRRFKKAKAIDKFFKLMLDYFAFVKYCPRRPGL